MALLGRWIPYNPNPQGKSVGDCAVRACAAATGRSWEQVYTDLALEGFAQCDLPSADYVWGRYLHKHGFRRALIQDDCETGCTVEGFCRQCPHGIYVLALNGHVVTVQDGSYLDSWDSGAETPIYYWYREEDDY